MKVYADEVANTPVRVNLINPGPTRTGMRAKAFPGEDPASLKPPDHVVETFVKLAHAHLHRQRQAVRPEDRRGAVADAARGRTCDAIRPPSSDSALDRL